ncbi:DNA-binding MarR family transcriptional regulator [Okibacterium sp. HSC-33S16]|uniref:MarR family winged helix-turn-helix transcriptional regulator n=1 Tax=Okibacterium sp. HSC-33S16 TaxID=2910965 RepID=UPI0020A19365|nr:MarR family winged helix-turn-helix transcriptional regulator [Okibacterium sp. HSC-33S16]MCP2032368.1 DNA-binding MarR family transcriptional regulator [Okibacterium sp. HSC-33S16]
MSAETSQPRWLDDREKAVWLTLREFIWEFPTAMDRQLQRDSALSTVEYSVLAALSECPGFRKRSSDLAADLSWDRSRLSHLVKRMEVKGMVERAHTDSDGRGQEIVLTEVGWEEIRAAAPGHVTFVRESVFDPLTPDEQDQLESMLTRIRAQISGEGLWGRQRASTTCPTDLTAKSEVCSTESLACDSAVTPPAVPSAS